MESDPERRRRTAPNSADRRSLRDGELDADVRPTIWATPSEEVGVAGIARDTKSVERRDTAVNERHLGFRQRVSSRDEVDVAHRALPPDREIENSRAYSTAKQTSFECAAPGMRNVEDRFVERCLRRQSGRGEQKLLVRCDMGIDPGEDRRPKGVESEARMPADGHRGDDVSGLVKKDARRDAVAEVLPIVPGRRNRVGALRSRRARDREERERRERAVDSPASPNAIRSVTSLTHSNSLTSMRQKLSDLEIQRALGGLAGWARRGDALVKTFIFARFADGIAFVDRVAKAADEMDHHPDIDIRYTKVTMVLSTHDAGGITSSDLKLAERIESVTT